MNRRYASATSFRTALEQRLRQRAQQTGIALDRLRKEVAYQRFLARLDIAAPAGAWALKGGMALLARLHDAARTTKDVDTTWRTSAAQLATSLDAAVELDLGDYFVFEIGRPRSLMAETDEGGQRFPVLALVDGREFERLQLDVNVVPNDPRPIERLQLRELLDIPGIDAPEVPAVPPAQQLAEKLHAYARTYSTGVTTRSRDLFDMLVVAFHLPLPSAGELTAVCIQTFDLRATRWPPEIQEPPNAWAAEWAAYVRDQGVIWTSLDQAATALAAFWKPLMASAISPHARWDPTSWCWVMP